MNSNRDFKAALFQVASSVGFLSHFRRNFPSMFYEEAKSMRYSDVMSSIICQVGCKGEIVPP